MTGRRVSIARSSLGVRRSARPARRPARRAAIAVALAALVACSDSPTTPREDSPAYDPRVAAQVEPGLVRYVLYHWPVGSTIRVYVDPTATPAGSDLRAAVVDGAARWSAAVREREFSIAVVTDPRQADVIVHYGEAPSLVGSPECAPPSTAAVGVTFVCPDFAAGRFHVLPLLAGGPGTVKMDVAVYHGRSSDEPQFRRAVTHEIGHVLGIGAHSPSTSDLMFSAPTLDAPSAGDARTLRYVLQQPADLVP